jgi:hypothetical protein
MEGALSENTSIRSVSIGVSVRLLDVMKVLMVSPKIERLQIVNHYHGNHDLPQDTITEMVRFIREDEKLKELGICQNGHGWSPNCGICESIPQQHDPQKAHFEGKGVSHVDICGSPSQRSLSQKYCFLWLFSGWRIRGKHHQHTLINTLVQTRLQELVMTDYQIHGNVDIVIAIKRKLECTQNNFTNLVIFPSNDYSREANWFRLQVNKITWNNFFQSEKDTWINRLLMHDNPSKILLFLAIDRAKEADKKRITKKPNILFYIIKNLCPKMLVHFDRDAREMSPKLEKSTHDNEQWTARKRPRNKQ